VAWAMCAAEPPDPRPQDKVVSPSTTSQHMSDIGVYFHLQWHDAISYQDAATAVATCRHIVLIQGLRLMLVPTGRVWQRDHASCSGVHRCIPPKGRAAPGQCTNTQYVLHLSRHAEFPSLRNEPRSRSENSSPQDLQTYT